MNKTTAAIGISVELRGGEATAAFISLNSKIVQLE